MSTTIEFDAHDYGADRAFTLARYRYTGDAATGWRIERDGCTVLELGPGYRALRVRQCGVCSTDLARHFLPFPLPQVIGHEVVAVADDGRRYVVEINASHASRGVAHDCPFCRAGLETHCPERVTLGIHDLPGGFGPWILAPVDACVEVPASVTDDVAVLVEPFAAALHAVSSVAPGPGERVAVLGPRRLGMLVVAAFAAVRDRAPVARRFTVAAVARDARLAELARRFGADEAHVVVQDGEAGDAALGRAFDVVVDTTGSPAGLERAVRLARREVHLKSTHGQSVSGLRHLTELVVDELAIARFDPEVLPAGSRVAWLASSPPPAGLAARCVVDVGDAPALAQRFWARTDGLPRADFAVVDDVASVDAAIRPVAGVEQSLVRPRGAVLLLPDAGVGGSPLLAAVASRGLRLSSSRCGDFREALELIAATPSLRDLGQKLVTHRFGASELPRAFDVAGSRACIKAIVAHDG